MNPLVYWIVRAAFQPAFHFGLSMRRLHRERIPAVGPVILASNHRSFLDPFVIGCCLRRPVYFVAKRELFDNRAGRPGSSARSARSRSSAAQADEECDGHRARRSSSAATSW